MEQMKRMYHVYLGIVGLLVIFLGFAMYPRVSPTQTQGREDYPSQTILNWIFNGKTRGMSVDVQDQTTTPLNFFLARLTGGTTTTAAAAIEDRTITLDDTTGFVDGGYLYIQLDEYIEGEYIFFLGQQVGAPAGNVITLDSPVNYDYPVGTPVYHGTRDMNVDGSVTPQIFQIAGPRQGAVDISSIVVEMFTADTISLQLFGDLPQLTNGLVVRTIIDGLITNLYNVKDNSEWAVLSDSFTAYEATHPRHSQDGLLLRDTWNGPENHGVVIRLESPDDKLQIVIQDDLTDLERFHISGEAHHVN